MNTICQVTLLVALLQHFTQNASGFAPYQSSTKFGTLFPVEELQRIKAKESVISDDKPSVLAALEHFLTMQAYINRTRPGSMEIVSRGSSKLANHHEIDVSIYATTELKCFVTIVSKGRTISMSQLEAATNEPFIRPLDEEEIISFCGFPKGSVPPLGHLSKVNVQIVIDQDLLTGCQTNKQMMLGSGGCAYWHSLVHPDIMTTLPNVQVAAITSIDEHQQDTVSGPGQDGPAEDEFASVRPFLDIDLPPLNIARLVVQRRDLSNPLTPALVTIKGQIGKVDRKGKRNALCELLPLPDDKEISSSNDSNNTLPWKLPSGETMAIRLLAGKQLLQKLGTTQGEAAIDHLYEGVVIQAQAITNVGSRDALETWVDDRTMEMVLIDYDIFTSDGVVDESSKSTKTHKNQPKELTAVPILPRLTLDDIFKNHVTVVMVDSLQTIESFERDFETLQFYLDEAGASMVGVDCEWQPNQLADPGEARPVVLLQLSFHALGKIYLFDLQAIFRPMLPKAEKMNSLETRASEILSKLWLSERIFKVGYQLCSDLRRTAASYPHITCFQHVFSVLEVDNLVKRILHISKQKKSRSITMSLARMTSHYMGKTVDKNYQISDWKARPLTKEQRTYAALDAAVAPALVEITLSSINATINPLTSRIERWANDEGLSNVVNSMRFCILEMDDSKIAKKLQAKQIVGDAWVVTQTWIAGQDAPDALT